MFLVFTTHSISTIAMNAGLLNIMAYENHANDDARIMPQPYHFRFPVRYAPMTPTISDTKSTQLHSCSDMTRPLAIPAV